MKTALLASLLFIPSPILASTPMHRIGEQGGFASEQICYRHLYREEYVPGTSMEPGRVKTFRDKVEVSCVPGVATMPKQIETIPHNHVSSPVEPTVHNHQPNLIPGTMIAHGGHVQQPGYYTAGYQQPQYNNPNVVVNNQPPQFNNQPQQVQPQYQSRGRVDDNNCAAGTTLGALAGGAGAALLTSGGKDLLWSIPLGMVGGSMVGCQLNGG